MTLPVGSLVVYETITATPVAYHLFAVIGEGERDKRDRPTTHIQAITRRTWYASGQPAGGLFLAPLDAVTAELTPIEEYGMRVDLGIYEVTGGGRVVLRRDEALLLLARRPWGSWPFHQHPDDFTGIDDLFLEKIVFDRYWSKVVARRAA